MKIMTQAKKAVEALLYRQGYNRVEWVGAEAKASGNMLDVVFMSFEVNDANTKARVRSVQFGCPAIEEYVGFILVNKDK